MAELMARKAVGCPSETCSGSKGQVPFRKYIIAKRNITSRSVQQIPIGNNVNGFTVKNSGTTIVIFNREPLQPGESQTIGGNEGEIFMGEVQITFMTPSPAPGTITDSCWITIKSYV